MKGFTKWLVRHRGLVIVICLLLMIPSVLGMAATKTKYDLLYYLPQDLETVQGQEILLEDFGKGAFSLLVTEGMSVSEQTDMENALKKIPHVDSVIGYASMTKGMFPLEIIPENIREMFSRGDCMLSAVFFDEGSSSEETMEAIQKVRGIAGEKCFVSGLSAVVTDTKQMVEEQEAIYVGIAVALCAVVLMITMDSFLLPIIFLLCIGVSILWNMGSNYFLGEISYITKAVAAVLQLGVTLDYSIFLWHSYKEQKSHFEDKDEAMAEAIHLTFTSILGSSLTTVAGFVSICFMSFTLGRDLGIVMSKGVVMGVLGTVVLLPCVIRLMDSAIEKTSHKPLLPDVGGIGRFVVKHYKVLAVILLIMIVPAFYGYRNVNVYYDMSKVMPQELPSVIANKKLESTFDMATTHLLLVDSDISQKDIRDMTEEMEQVDGVKNVVGIDSLLGAGIPESIVPKDVLSLVKGDRYQLMLINSAYVISSDEVNAQIDDLNAILKRYDAGGMLIGEAPSRLHRGQPDFDHCDLHHHYDCAEVLLPAGAAGGCHRAGHRRQPVHPLLSEAGVALCRADPDLDDSAGRDRGLRHPDDHSLQAEPAFRAGQEESGAEGRSLRRPERARQWTGLLRRHLWRGPVFQRGYHLLHVPAHRPGRSHECGCGTAASTGDAAGAG